MRVIIVCDHAHVNGGAAKIAIRSARGLAEAGCDVVYACTVGPVAEDLQHPRIRVALMDGDDIWRVKNPVQAAANGIWNAAAGRWLANVLAREAGPDTIVHLHHWTRAFSPAAVHAAAQSQLPVCVTLHDYFSFCPNGAYFHFPQNKPCMVKPMGMGCISSNCDRRLYAHKLIRLARQNRTDAALRAIRNLTFVHVAGFAETFARPFLPAHARHALVPNMIDAPHGKAATPASAKAVLFVGRLESEKAPHFLASAARKANMAIEFLGSGPMEAAIRHANPDAKLLGWQPPEAVYDIIAQARAVVAPSLWFEPGPLVIAEAQAMGVPGIVTRQTGAASFVRHGENGLLLDEVTEDALEQALRVIADDDAVARLGQTAYDDFWTAPFTTQRHSAETVAVYQSALRSRPA